MEPLIIYLLTRHFSDEGVGTFDTTEAAYEDETEAELEALAMNEAPDRPASIEFFVQPIEVKRAS